ncbi:tellurite resistance protein TerB, partial [Bifidobacterium longum subsp. longum]
QLMKYIKTRDALQAFYYLIAVDGSVRDDERALFDHIGDNLDAKHFHDYRKEIIDSCDERINQCHDSDDRYDVIVEGVDAVLSHRTDKRAAGIAPRLLLWNMLSVAFADGKYDAVESRLIR